MVCDLNPVAVAVEKSSLTEDPVWSPDWRSDRPDLRPEGGQGGLEKYPDLFRTMLLVLLDVIHPVKFRECTNVEREKWSTFDPQEFMVQGTADFHFARFIGGYLHSNIL